MLVEQPENTDFIGNLINSWIIGIISYFCLYGQVYVYGWFPAIGQLLAPINFEAWSAILGSPGLLASIVLPMKMWPALVTSHEAFFNEADALLVEGEGAGARPRRRAAPPCSPALAPESRAVSGTACPRGESAGRGRMQARRGRRARCSRSTTSRSTAAGRTTTARWRCCSAARRRPAPVPLHLLNNTQHTIF